jgi:peptidoglycan hydrolase CwlO-like protein
LRIIKELEERRKHISESIQDLDQEIIKTMTKYEDVMEK